MSARLRVKTRTSSPERCTWMRAPSSLYSTDASPVVSTASDGLAAVAASIGSTGRPTTSPTASSSAAVAGEGEASGLAEVARQHGGAAHDVAGAVGGASDRVGDHALEGAGAHVAEQHAAEEALFALGGPRRELAQRPGTFGRRSEHRR